MRHMEYFGKTDIGKKRESNQDSFRISTVKVKNDEILLAAVCDGMGGASGGSVASSMAVECFFSTFESEVSDLCAHYGKQKKISDFIFKALEEAVYSANVKLFEKSQSDISLSGMGTTLVACAIYENEVYAVNVGDSRLYMIEKGSVCQLTRDHSYVQSLVDSGHITAGEAKKHPNRNIIMRAVGTEREVEPDLFKIPLADKTLMLCSDGLSNTVSEAEMEKAVSNANIEDACGELIAKANKNGGTDNITAVVIRPDKI